MSKVIDYMTERALAFKTFEHQRTTTSIEEARVLGISADEVAKTLVLDTDGGHALAVIPGSRRLDLKRTQQIVGSHAHLASEREIEKDFPEYALGAVPPIAGLLNLPTYVDPELARHETIVFAAGSQTESVRMRTADLLGDPKATVVPLTDQTHDRVPEPRLGVVVLDVEGVSLEDQRLQRLIECATTTAFATDRTLDTVEVRTPAGRILARMPARREAGPIKDVATPSAIIDPRIAHRTPTLLRPSAEDEQPPGPLPHFETRGRPRPRRPMMDEYELPPSVRERIVRPDDPVDIVRAILEAGHQAVSVQGDVLRCGDEAIVVLSRPLGSPSIHDALNHAYIRFRSTGAKRGTVIAVSYLPGDDIQRREILAPELGHVGRDAIQRMADAVALGANPLRFVQPPVLGRPQLARGNGGRA